MDECKSKGRNFEVERLCSLRWDPTSRISGLIILGEKKYNGRKNTL